MITDERIEAATMISPAGIGGKPHVHPTEQLPVPLKGSVRYLPAEPCVAVPGEVVLILADPRHGAQIPDFTVSTARTSWRPGASPIPAGKNE